MKILWEADTRMYVHVRNRANPHYQLSAVVAVSLWCVLKVGQEDCFRCDGWRTGGMSDIARNAEDPAPF